MEKAAQLRRALQQLALQSPNFAVAVVKSIEGDTCTLTVEGNPPFDVPGVRLKPTIGTDNRMLLTPKKGSAVLLALLSDDWRNAVVLAVDELQSIEISTDNLNVEIDCDSGTVSVKNNDVSLIGLFNQLLGLLKTFQVHTAVGASGTPLPTTITALNAFETSFKKLLK